MRQAAVFCISIGFSLSACDDAQPGEFDVSVAVSLDGAPATFQSAGVAQIVFKIKIDGLESVTTRPAPAESRLTTTLSGFPRAATYSLEASFLNENESIIARNVETVFADSTHAPVDLGTIDVVPSNFADVTFRLAYPLESGQPVQLVTIQRWGEEGCFSQPISPANERAADRTCFLMTTTADSAITQVVHKIPIGIYWLSVQGGVQPEGSPRACYGTLRPVPFVVVGQELDLGTINLSRDERGCYRLSNAQWCRGYCY
jgi:hypothetical protein